MFGAFANETVVVPASDFCDRKPGVFTKAAPFSYIKHAPLPQCCRTAVNISSVTRVTFSSGIVHTPSVSRDAAAVLMLTSDACLHDASAEVTRCSALRARKHDALLRLRVTAGEGERDLLPLAAITSVAAILTYFVYITNKYSNLSDRQLNDVCLNTIVHTKPYDACFLRPPQSYNLQLL